jgi:molybdopterin-guanine dinucleotide biosynthesis protein A
MDRTDALILAGGRASEAMQALTGTQARALFPYKDKPFVQWVYEALRDSSNIGRIAVVGPGVASSIVTREMDVFVAERDTIEQNLFGGLEVLKPTGRVLITASDNPLLTTVAFDDLLARAPKDAAAAYPFMRYEGFLRVFPRAENVAITLRDGVYIGGGCAVIRADAIPALHDAIRRILASRKSKWKMVGLLGIQFALRFQLRIATAAEVEQRCTKIAGVPICFVPNCDPVLAIDIDDPEDWEYLLQWSDSAVG